MFESNRREKRGWGTDYPGADLNFSTRLAELTRASVTMRHDAEEDDAPDAVVVRLTDDALFKCPFLLMEDAGTADFSADEARRLGEYLLKGGFLWVDDFWGTDAWEQWVSQIRKVFDAGQYPIVDLPPTHPIFRAFVPVTHVPQVTNIQFWRNSGGTETSERGADSAEVHTRAITDARGRIMVLMTHNTDLGDSWEREGEDAAYFYQFSPPGYAVGIDVLVYALTH